MTDGWTKAVSLLMGKPLAHGDSSGFAMDMFEQRHSTGDYAHSTRSKPAGVFFEDGRRRIDFVLVYHLPDTELRKPHGSSKSVVSDKAQRRAFFEANLTKEGLVLEKDEWRRTITDAAHEEALAPSSSLTTTTVFVKVHGPFSTLGRYAERLNVKVPLKLRDAFASASIGGDADKERRRSLANVYRSFRESSIKHLRSAGPFFRRIQAQAAAPVTRGSSNAPTITVRSGENEASAVHPEKPQEKAPYVTHRFRRRNLNMYAGVERQDEFFTPTQRIEIVWEILQKARNDQHDEKKRGIELLVETGVYECAFPLHDGEDLIEVDKENSVATRSQPEPPANQVHRPSDRQQLRRTWANWKVLAKRQPLDVIRR